MNSLDGYTILDIGASGGGSMRYGQSIFGGKAIGIDLDPAKVEKTRAAGLPCIQGDAADMDFPDNSVPAVTMMHFLEHLPSAEIGARVIASAIRVASQFVFMRGPNFDQRRYLKELGLKKYYADWNVHKWHHGSAEIAEILAKHGHGFRSAVYQSETIHDSFDRNIHPLAAKRNRGPYDAAVDPPKPFTAFDRRVFATLSFVLVKDPSIRVSEIVGLTSVSYFDREGLTGEPRLLEPVHAKGAWD